MCKKSDFIHCDHGLYLDIVYLQRQNRKWQMRDDLIHKLAYSPFFCGCSPNKISTNDGIPENGISFSALVSQAAIRWIPNAEHHSMSHLTQCQNRFAMEYMKWAKLVCPNMTNAFKVLLFWANLWHYQTFLHDNLTHKTPRNALNRYIIKKNSPMS